MQIFTTQFLSGSADTQLRRGDRF